MRCQLHFSLSLRFHFDSSVGIDFSRRVVDVSENIGLGQRRLLLNGFVCRAHTFRQILTHTCNWFAFTNRSSSTECFVHMHLEPLTRPFVNGKFVSALDVMMGLDYVSDCPPVFRVMFIESHPPLTGHKYYQSIRRPIFDHIPHTCVPVWICRENKSRINTQTPKVTNNESNNRKIGISI